MAKDQQHKQAEEEQRREADEHEVKSSQSTALAEIAAQKVLLDRERQHFEHEMEQGRRNMEAEALAKNKLISELEAEKQKIEADIKNLKV